MRKKLLRSRSGFEKPESREEAIMQNILGASNVLEPSESNIEEILKSILYNTPYTKEAEFEIEKILLAIKNNGTYDGEGESRDMKILIAILNDLDYTEETESRIEELFIEWLHQRSSINVLEGVPPLTFTSRGLPLINYLIEGNTAQSGTPTPDSPVMPNGTGERTGQLIPYPFYSSDGEYAGVTWATTTHSIKASGTTTEGTNFYFFRNKLIKAGTYRITINGTHKGMSLLLRDTSTSTMIANLNPSTDTYTFTLENDMLTCSLYFNQGSANVSVDIDCTIMLNTGSTPLPYEPYGIKIPISSGGVTTNVYLGEVQSTRNIIRYELTGEENWIRESGNTYALERVKQAATGYHDALCTHYVLAESYNTLTGTDGTFSVSKRPALFIHDENFTTAAQLKKYLATQYANGTPVTIWYVLATEETAVVNEPIMKIGDYADSISMEQTGIEIPTINGSNTFDVNTTVKPSNVYIEYK